MTARLRGALALLAATLLVGGCSNHSGLRRLRPSNDVVSSSVAVPGGLAGSVSSSASTTAKPTRPRPSSTSAAAGSTSAGGTSRSVHDNRTGGSSSLTGRATPSRTASAPAPAPRGPALAVSPDSGLLAADVVQVTGQRFRAAESVDLLQCLADSGSCAPLTTRATADGQGRFAKSLLVTSSVAGESCMTHSCLVVARGNLGSRASAPIRFG